MDSLFSFSTVVLAFVIGLSGPVLALERSDVIRNGAGCMKNVINNLAPKRLLPPLIIFFSLLIANINVLYASDIYQCATSKDVYDALDTVKPGDTIVLQGGKVYENR